MDRRSKKNTYIFPPLSSLKDLLNFSPPLKYRSLHYPLLETIAHEEHYTYIHTHISSAKGPAELRIIGNRLTLSPVFISTLVKTVGPARTG